ncbi:MAG: HAD family hydrolase [Cyanobacteria bacterium P01_H01_bin.15]
MATIFTSAREYHDIQGIWFDKDGTLADSSHYLNQLTLARSQSLDLLVPDIQDSVLEILGWRDQTVDPLGLMAAGSRLENEIAIAGLLVVRGHTWGEARQLVTKAFAIAEQQLQGLECQSTLFPEVLDLLDSLVQTPIKLGILTADTEVHTQEFLAQYGLKRYFSAIVGAEQGRFKPDPALYQAACQELGCIPQETLMVGDTPGDITMALQAGAKDALWIIRQTLNKPRDLLGAQGIASLTDIQVHPR